MLTRKSRHPDASSYQRPHELWFQVSVIRIVDTDVVVLAVAHFQGLPNIEQL